MPIGNGAEENPSTLRALTQVATPVGWAALEERLIEAAPAERVALIRRVERALAHWPDDLRRLTFSQVPLPGRTAWRVGASKHDAPWLTLARTIEVGVEDLQHIESGSTVVRDAFPTLRRLDVHGTLRVPGLREAEGLANLTHALPALCHIDLSNLVLVSPDRDEMGRSAPFWQLLLSRLPTGRIRHLELRSQPFGLAGVDALLHSGLSNSLRHLGLGACRLGAAGAAALGNWPANGPLASIDLDANRIDTGSLVGWSGKSILRRLAAVACGANPIGPEFVRVLGALPRPWNLRALDVSGCGIGMESVAVLASARALARVEDVRLAGCGITDDMSGFLLEGRLRARLRVIDLASTLLTDRFVRGLVTRPAPPRLELLSIRENDISDDGLESLRRWAADAPRLVYDLASTLPTVTERYWATRRARTA